MSEKLYDYPYYDLSKPFNVDGTNAVMQVYVVYDIDEDRLADTRYRGIRYRLINVDDKSQPVKLTLGTWENVYKLIGMMQKLYQATIKIESVVRQPAGFREIVTEKTKAKTFGDMLEDLNKDSKYYDDIIKAIDELNRFHNNAYNGVRFTGRRDTSDSGLTFTDICKDIVWPFL